MTMITPSYLGETIEYSSLHACRSTLEDPTVSWADTITHAEWLIEVIETYCKTVMIAGQLRSPLKEIPPEKIADLLAIKRKLGLPDARYPDDPEPVETDLATDVFKRTSIFDMPSGQEIDQLVNSLALQVMDFFKEAHADRR